MKQKSDTSTATTQKSAKYVYNFGRQTDGNATMRALLGGKGANLAEMASIGLPVPPGFTISTEVCTYFYDHSRSYPKSLPKDVEQAMSLIEEHMGRQFGSRDNPLLVSVRSGARDSMPGMMDTILNLGLNDKTVEGLSNISGNPRFAWDCYRRFIQMYGDVVMGVQAADEESEDPFHALLDEMKHALGKELDNELTADELRELVSRYKLLINRTTGKSFPQNVYEQLWGAVGAVFGSWKNDRAILYRQQYGIPADWGTAVNIQSMVFGNAGDDSGTGVAQLGGVHAVETGVGVGGGLRGAGQDAGERVRVVHGQCRSAGQCGVHGLDDAADNKVGQVGQGRCVGTSAVVRPLERGGAHGHQVGHHQCLAVDVQRLRQADARGGIVLPSRSRSDGVDLGQVHAQRQVQRLADLGHGRGFGLGHAFCGLLRAQLGGVSELGFDDGLHQGGQWVDHSAARSGAVTAFKRQAGADVRAALRNEGMAFLCGGEKAVDAALFRQTQRVIPGVDLAGVVHVHPDFGAIEVAVLDDERGGGAGFQGDVQRSGGIAWVAHGVAVEGRADGEGGVDAREVGRGCEDGGAGQAAAADRAEQATGDRHIACRKACARVFAEGEGDGGTLIGVEGRGAAGDGKRGGEGVCAFGIDLNGQLSSSCAVLQGDHGRQAASGG